MNRTFASLVVVCMLLSSPTTGEAAIVPAVATSIGRALLKYFGREGGQEATEYLAKKGGKEVIERVTTTAAKQGGEEAVEQVAKLASKHGPDALAALDNAPNVVPVLKALGELPESQVQTALVRLAAGTPGRELSEAIGRFGTAALRSELKHPGVGMILVRSLGDEGAELAARLTDDQAIALARHAKEIAALPQPQRAGLLAMFRGETDRMFTFMGRFVEDNPGKMLFSVATTTVILAQPERILGGDEITFDADGNPVVVTKAGLIGRSMDAGGEVAAHVSDKYLQPLFFAVMAFVGTFAAIWVLIKTWQIWMFKKVKAKLTSKQ